MCIRDRLYSSTSIELYVTVSLNTRGICLYTVIPLKIYRFISASSSEQMWKETLNA